MRHIRRFVPLLALTCLLGACSNPQSEQPEHGDAGADVTAQPDAGQPDADTSQDASSGLLITVHPAPLRLATGAHVQLRLHRGASRLDPSEVSLGTTDSAVAEVSEAGVLTGVSVGAFDLLIDYDGQQHRVSGAVVAPRWTDVAVSSGLTCAIDRQGALYCAGALVHDDKFDAQGAYARAVGELHPVGSQHRFAKVAVGLQTICAVDTDGALWCRGRRWRASLDEPVDFENSFEKLGTPAQTSFTDIVAGERHFCALSDTGDAYCWGLNDFEQLGDRFDSEQVRRVDVSASFTSLAAGGWHTCGLDRHGRAYCWGANAGGQLGTGNDYGPGAPGAIHYDQRFEQLAAGRFHTCGLRDQKVYCWGYNESYQLGFDNPRGASLYYWAPQASRTAKITKVVAARQSTCALNIWGQVICWGANSQGQLGGEPAEAQTPDTVVEGQFSDLVLSDSHACGLTLDGGLRCWGLDRAGALAGARTTFAAEPQLVSASGGELAAGTKHTCQLADETLRCWGDNSEYQFGDSGVLSAPQPRTVQYGLQDIAAGATTSCGVRDHAVYCWGLSYDYELGNGDQFAVWTSPIEVDLPQPADSVAATAHTVMARSGLTTYYWGGGQSQITEVEAMSKGPSGDYDQATTMGSATIGGAHGCGIDAGGEVYCWGRATELDGNPDADHWWGDAYPIQSDQTFSEVAAGARHTCALSTEGALYYWGELFGNQGLVEAPTEIVADSGLVSLASGGGHFGCGLDADGKAYCWGRNTAGALGDGTFTDRNTPTPVAGELRFEQLVLGGNHACGVTVDGETYCWGSNGMGQLGIGGTLYYRNPQTVVVSSEEL